MCRLSASLHLRLLTVLCNDTLEGASMRAELAGRVDQISALQSERHQTQLEVILLVWYLRQLVAGILRAPLFHTCASWVCMGRRSG